MAIYWEEAALREFVRVYGPCNPLRMRSALDLFESENEEYLKAFQAGLDMGLSEGEARFNAIKIAEKRRR